jgi:AraC-like DNA-binding protein
MSAQLAKAGVASAPLLRRVGLSEADVHTPETRISIDQVARFFELVAEAAPDPGFAYRAGLQFHLTNYGLLGFAILSAPDYRRALAIAERFHQLATPLAECAFTEQDGVATWSVTRIAHPLIRGRAYEFVVEFHLGVFTAIQRDLMGQGIRATAVTLTFDLPPGARLESEALDGASVGCGARNTVSFPAARLDEPTQMGSPVVNQMLIRICEAQLEELRRHEGLAGRVRSAVVANGLRKASASAVAGELGMSERSLRRHLEAEGASLTAIHDELRLQAAVSRLRDGRLPIDEIAEAVGFSDAGNFRRAFRRWTGQAPSAFRGAAFGPGRAGPASATPGVARPRAIRSLA